jgi:hypothetical protein
MRTKILLRIGQLLTIQKKMGDLFTKNISTLLSVVLLTSAVAQMANAALAPRDLEAENATYEMELGKHKSIVIGESERICFRRLLGMIEFNRNDEPKFCSASLARLYFEYTKIKVLNEGVQSLNEFNSKLAEASKVQDEFNLESSQYFSSQKAPGSLLCESLHGIVRIKFTEQQTFLVDCVFPIARLSEQLDYKRFDAEFEKLVELPRGNDAE